jgi:hypothetical protein
MPPAAVALHDQSPAAADWINAKIGHNDKHVVPITNLVTHPVNEISSAR